VLLSALPRMKAALFSQPSPEMASYYATHPADRVMMALLFLGLLAALILGYWDASQHLQYLHADD
jgi:hypothetical protein